MSQNNLDYPEHLNPFKSRRGSITRSFRKVFNSFTGKDKQKPHVHDIRQHRHTAQPVPIPPSPQHRQATHLPTALPRSRFKERLEKTESLKRTSKERHWYNEEHNAANPFEEEGVQKVSTGAGQAPIPAVRTKLRRRKKRTAPLPPGTISSDGQFLDIPSRNGSKWSLTSTETDASSICYSEYDETEKTQEEHNEKSIEILEITRKIAQFTDDANNNVTASEIKKDDSTTPQLQEDPLITSDEKKSADESEEQKIVIEEVDARVIVEEVDAKVIVEEVDAKVIVEEVDAKVAVEEEKEKLVEESETGEQDEEDKTEKVRDEEEETGKQDEEAQQNTGPCEKESVEDVVKQLEVVEEQITNGCVENIEKRIDRNQNSLLRVRIIDNQEVVLRHPEDYYDDSPPEKYSIKQRIEHFESYRSSSPTSKIRQTVLTKENLLGTE